jgi:hypothetical protein
MRQTSLRRAPQRLTVDRTLGDTARPLVPGACPACFRVIKIKNGRRAWHNDMTGQRCAGSRVHVGAKPVHLSEIPPVKVAERNRYLPDRGAQPPTLASNGTAVTYTGRSDRTAANGRGECDGCGRHLPLNGDGTVRRHRVRHLDPFSPYCMGGAA